MSAPPSSSPPARATGDVLALAWPMAIAMLGEVTIGLVDTRLVGVLGADALAGVGVGGSLFFLFYLAGLGFCRSVKVLTAHAVGAGRTWVSYRYAEVGAGACWIFGMLAMVWVRQPEGVLALLGVKAETATIAADFVAARGLGLPAACALAALVEHRQGLGTVWGVTSTVVVGNLINALFAWALIGGHGGLPALGAAGAGFGSTISECAQLAIIGTWFVVSRRRAGRAAGGDPPLPTAREAGGELARIGLPTALHMTCEFLALVAFTGILGRLEASELAAHQIAVSVGRAAFMPGIAIAEAGCVLVGRALGRGDLGAADQAVRDTQRVAMTYMFACGLVFVAFGGPLAHFFSHDPNIARAARRLLAMAAAFQLVDATNLVMRGALRGAKDVRWAAFWGILFLWSCVPTAAYVLGTRAGWGVIGGWCGFGIEASLSAAAFTWRYRHGAWRRRFAR